MKNSTYLWIREQNPGEIGAPRVSSNQNKVSQAAARTHANNVRHRQPFLESEAYLQALAKLPKGPAVVDEIPVQHPPGWWIKVLLLVGLLAATLWLGWELKTLATSTFAAHLQAIWRELNNN